MQKKVVGAVPAAAAGARGGAAADRATHDRQHTVSARGSRRDPIHAPGGASERVGSITHLCSRGGRWNEGERRGERCGRRAVSLLAEFFPILGGARTRRAAGSPLASGWARCLATARADTLVVAEIGAGEGRAAAAGTGLWTRMARTGKDPSSAIKHGASIGTPDASLAACTSVQLMN